jgi:hypothetical protein
MIRTQIRLTESQAERLKVAAARRGISVAELIRQGVDSILQSSGERPPEEIYQRALAAAGKHRSGAADVAVRHDGYLADDFSR